MTARGVEHLPCLLGLAIEVAEALVDVFHIGPSQAMPRILGQPGLPLHLCCCVIACRVQPCEPPCRRLQHGMVELPTVHASASSSSASSNRHWYIA
nr:hypothetical protein [Pseudomonas brassicae]